MQVAARDKLEDAQARIAGLFDLPVAVCVIDPRRSLPAPLGQEAAHLARAVPKRQREFAAGRAAARRAMEALDLPPVPILAGEDRAPIWPSGLFGSISHKSDLCAAVVTTACHSVGLDIEEDTDLSADLVATICSPAEQARIAGPRALRLAKLIFSAKEALYKAQYPLTGLVFGFDHVDITLTPDERRFTAIFLKPAGIFAPGDAAWGRYTETLGHMVTGIALGDPAAKGE